MAVNADPGLSAGLRLEALSIAWMVIEASASLVSGGIAHSLLLIVFGADSLIELISAALVFYELCREAQPGRSEGEIEKLRVRVSKASGYLLYALACYVVLQAIYGLFHHHAAETSLTGIAVAVIAALGMPLLARAKLRVAEQIGNAALRADAVESLTCGYLSWMLLAGLAVNGLAHVWWIDAVASLAITPLLLREAREALTGKCRYHDCE